MYVEVFKEDRAMLDSKSSARTKCFSCGKVGHLKRDCQATTPVRSSNNTGTKKKFDICYYYNRFKKPNCLIQAGVFLNVNLMNHINVPFVVMLSVPPINTVRMHN